MRLAGAEAKLPFLLAVAGDFFLFVPLGKTRADNANHANDNTETLACSSHPSEEKIHP